MVYIELCRQYKMFGESQSIYEELLGYGLDVCTFFSETSPEMLTFGILPWSLMTLTEDFGKVLDLLSYYKLRLRLGTGQICSKEFLVKDILGHNWKSSGCLAEMYPYLDRDTQEPGYYGSCIGMASDRYTQKAVIHDVIVSRSGSLDGLTGRLREFGFPEDSLKRIREIWETTDGKSMEDILLDKV